MRWFWQKKWWEVGNFIMATPMLHAVAMVQRKPVGVYFDTKHVRKMFLDCSFIRILKNKPDNACFASSIPPYKKRREDESNYEVYIRVYARKMGFKGDNIPLPYVDKIPYDGFHDGKKRIAVMHGCLNSNPRKKLIPVAVRSHILLSVLNKGYTPIIIGNKNDYKRFWLEPLANIGKKAQLVEVSCRNVSIRDNLAKMNACEAFISNDTGLYHAAAALGLNGLVMWTISGTVKNMTPCKQVKHVESESHDSSVFVDSIDRFLEKL